MGNQCHFITTSRGFSLRNELSAFPTHLATLGTSDCTLSFQHGKSHFIVCQCSVGYSPLGKSQWPGHSSPWLCHSPFLRIGCLLWDSAVPHSSATRVHVQGCGLCRSQPCLLADCAPELLHFHRAPGVCSGSSSCDINSLNVFSDYDQDEDEEYLQPDNEDCTKREGMWN